jgi:AcrR family transcriptional regulator
MATRTKSAQRAEGVSTDTRALRLFGLFPAFQSQEDLLDRENLSNGATDGLRERKKLMTRQLISDTAFEMFLEYGFDEVRVTEVAAACGVSEKTVYNYFPTKESMILDREEAMADGISRALGPAAQDISPIDAIVDLIAEDVRHTYSMWDQEPAPKFDVTVIQRFAELLSETPALRAALQEMMHRLVEVAARAMATRAGMDPEDPEPQISAEALVGLWRIALISMRRHSDGKRPASEIPDLVLHDVHRASRLLTTGLWSFGIVVQGTTGSAQMKAATESVDEARKEVVSAIRRARRTRHQGPAKARRRT